MSAVVRVVFVCALGVSATVAPQAAEDSSPVRMGVTAFRHDGEILAFEFAPDGKSVATIGADRTLRLWELPGGRELLTVRSEQTLTALGFAEGGAVLALAATVPDIRFFDVPSGKERAPVRTKQQRIYSLAFAPKGPAWAAGGDAALLLWENGNDGEPQILAGHRRGVNVLAFSPDGRSLASAGVEDYACLWTLPKPEKPVELTATRFARVGALAFSPDGRSLASGGADRSVRLWKLEDRTVASTLEANGEIRCLAWSPDGTSIVAGSEGSDLFLWNTAGSSPLRKIDSRNLGTRGVSFTRDGTLLAAAGSVGALRFWTPADGVAVALPGEGHRSAVTAIAVLRPGGTIVSADKDGAVLIWDASGRRLHGHEHLRGVRALAISPVEGLLASAGNDNFIRLWHFEAGRLLNPMDDTDGIVTGLAFTPEPTELLVAQNGRIQVWSLRTRKMRETIVDSVAPARSFVLDREGRRAAWADLRRGVGVLPLTGERRPRYLEGHEGAVEGVAFADAAVASVGADGTLRVWDVETGASSLSRASGPLRAVACSADGRIALTGGDDGRVRLWELASGKEIASLATGDAPVGAVAYGATDRTILAGTARGLVLMWDLDRVLGGAPATIESLASEDAGEAQRAMTAFAAAGADAVAKLKPRLSEKVEKPAALVEQLDDPDFKAREKAARELEWAASEEDLREALEQNPSPERRLRLEEIRKALKLPRVRWTQGLFTVRAIALLERIGTAEARELLESLSRQSGSRGAREARQALTRLKASR